MVVRSVAIMFLTTNTSPPASYKYVCELDIRQKDNYGFNSYMLDFVKLLQPHHFNKNRSFSYMKVLLMATHWIRMW
jgi:hypothetical protein